MKCQEFETIIIDLARDRIMEAAERETAQAHAQSCSECAGRLADERALTAGLRRFAAASETTEAPARVGSALQAAFRERFSIGAAAISADSKRRQWRRRAWAAAAAIALLFAAGFIALRIDRKAPGDEPTRAGVSQPPPRVGSNSSSMPKETEAVTGKTTTPKVFKPKHKAPASRSKPYNALGNRPTNNPTRAVRNDEIATDFIPVSGSELMSLDEGLVVRIELPRSALVSFGLPMNIERAGERIKADVVLGNDGLARAIRFVH